MHQHSPYTFQIGYGFDWATCCAQLAQAATHIDPPHHYLQQRTYYDTHDWSLFRAGLRLEVEPAEQDTIQLTLKRDRDHRTLTTGTVQQPLDFLESLPKRGFHRRLAPIIQVRRLLPMSTIEVEGERRLIRDGEGKGLGEVRHERWLTEEGGGLDPRQWLMASPLQGYETEFDQILTVVRYNPAVEAVQRPLMYDICTYAHRHPGDYNNKPPITLSAKMPIAEAVRAILRLYFKVMQDNEQGIIADLDTEYLHDYRIAVRKSRSILNLIKGLFPPKQLQPLMQTLAELQTLTGPTRDMDAYYLNVEEYMTHMTPEVTNELGPLLEQIQLRRTSSQQQLVEGLQSDWYRRFKQSWIAFLEPTAPHPKVQPKGLAPALDIASQTLHKRYLRALDHGRSIHDSTPAAALHDLRKDCKKLRYVIEFFSPLYKQGATQTVLKQLKQLQDYLGYFQDLDTHQLMLQQISQQMVANNNTPPQALIAIGRLWERLAINQQQTRHGFAAAFAPFAANEVQQAVTTLFTHQTTQSR